ncbi:hypothetical protein Q1W73_01570 [Asticcacaulis sp. ZE23SCel15]|uniref:hypothetical protein n=1 Tax=Asticcacaulis sp. ZE23SCel15 TaxID=3059027 RepID=UPI00265F4B24|nr:hypothetical protein [Asticcacaulis sp. ZE23SCel15]WKL57698.1 hypothetical protein Q1W73_01570 [Asticcacaulis sp. ZE23SCel15]
MSLDFTILNNEELILKSAPISEDLFEFILNFSKNNSMKSLSYFNNYYEDDIVKNNEVHELIIFLNKILLEIPNDVFAMDIKNIIEVCYLSLKTGRDIHLLSD